MQEKKNCFLIQDEDVKIIFTKRNIDAKNNEEIKKVLKENNFNYGNVKYLTQIHSNKVLKVDNNFLNGSEADALVTNFKNTPLLIFTADCVPIIFYDKKTKTYALSHAGWRGVYDNIAKNTIRVMCENYNVKVEDVKVIIAPAISFSNYKVSLELVEKFKERGYSFYKKEAKNYYLDLVSIVEQQLLDEKVLKQNIMRTNFCTVNNNDKFFSYRVDNKTNKRIGTVIEIS